jgi:glycosyltransferase involved in cell wall biosynthesis
MKRIDILLPTYNGERYLTRQVDSVLAQMDERCRLLVRDDGSSDGTRGLLRQIVDRHPDRVVLLDEDGRLGACGNVNRLLERSEADYVLLCDQDDAWLPGHLAKPIERMEAIERQRGAATPILVHTDLTVADEELESICPSFWSYSKLDPVRGSRLNRLLLQNVVTGCVTTLNRAMVRLACPIPATAAMHDWWLALVASAFGHIEAISEPTTLYRQHGKNCVGASGYTWAYVRRKLGEVVRGDALAKWRRTTQRQAEGFQQRFADRLSPEQRAMVAAYVQLETAGPLRRRTQIFKYGFFKAGLVRNLGWLAMI